MVQAKSRDLHACRISELQLSASNLPVIRQFILIYVYKHLFSDMGQYVNEMTVLTIISIKVSVPPSAYLADRF